MATDPMTVRKTPSRMLVERPDRRGHELGHGARGLALEARNAAEQEERDPVDGDAELPGDERVRELVEDHRDEEQNGRDDRGRDGGRRAPVGVPAGECGGEAPPHQERDEDPRRVDCDLDAEDAAEPQGTWAGHFTSSATLRGERRAGCEGWDGPAEAGRPSTLPDRVRGRW